MSQGSFPSWGTYDRAVQAVLDVLPRSAKVEVPKGYSADSVADLVIGGQPVNIKWIGEGTLGRVRELFHRFDSPPDIVVARRLSPGARETLRAFGIGWVDETGAAEIVMGTLIVVRSGQSPVRFTERRHWTPSILSVTEALLVGTRPTVADTAAATGLSTGSCTAALRFLTDQDLLDADAPRGRHSARRLADPHRLLEDYAQAAEAQARKALTLSVGTAWRDPIGGLTEVGHRWDRAHVSWAASGLAAAAVIAPLVTHVASVEVYVDANTPVGLEAVAADAALRPIEGGRLSLSPFPTVTARRLASTANELRVAPWPRVFVDLRRAGVRGEEAAEHLREVMSGP